MRLLLDTHAFLWWMNGDAKLPAKTRETVKAAQLVYVSASTAWEIATKHRIGKLPEAAAFAGAISSALQTAGFQALPVSIAHGQLAGELSGDPKDPFDRMLIAQTLIEDLSLVSNEKSFDAHGISRLW